MRADEFLTLNGFFESRTKAKQAIERGEVFFNGKRVIKPSEKASEDIKPEIKSAERFVSLGGYKLAKALKDFGYGVKGLTVADVGASTGGFTDCLLQNGAEKVYAVDLNDGLLHKSLKEDKRVISVIKNAKNLSRKDLKDITLITADLSFISAKQVLPIFYDILPDGGNVILLIKPQFEIGEKRRFKNGIIRDGKLIKNACKEVFDAAKETGFSALKMTTAPVSEDKNTEFLILLSKNTEKSVDFNELFDI